MRLIFFFVMMLQCSFVSAQSIDSVYVSNEKELKHAIKSNRVILINVANLVLHERLVFDKIKNLSILGNLPSNSNLKTTPTTDFSSSIAILIKDCENINFKQLDIQFNTKHKCLTNLLVVRNSKNIRLLHCNLLGSEKMDSSCFSEYKNSDNMLIHLENSNVGLEKTKIYTAGKYINYNISFSTTADKSSISFYDCDFFLNPEKKDITHKEPFYKNCNFYTLHNNRLLLKDYNGYYPEIPKNINAKIMVNYPPWKDDEYSEGTLGGSCNNTCKVSATSTLSPTKNNNYLATNMISFDSYCHTKAWVEGVDGSGIGERIKYEIVNILGDGEPWRMDLSFKFINGYAKNLKTWKNNNRVKTFKCYRNGIYVATIHLKDTPNAQEIDLFDIYDKNRSTVGEILEFEIVAVYKGDKYDDTAISLLVFNCAP